MFAMGVYVFLAALTEWRRFVYPGKREAIIRIRQKLGVAEALGLYVSMGLSLAKRDPDNHSHDVDRWIWALRTLVLNAFGMSQVMLLGIAANDPPRWQVDTITDNLKLLIQRTNGATSASFRWDIDSDWCTYLTEIFPLTMPDFNSRMTRSL